MSPSTSPRERPQLQPSKLGKYIALDMCPRYFKFGIEETGFDEIGHNKGSFRESFGGGNLVEKKAGNEFEEEIIDVIKDEVTDFYDVEALTLSMATKAIPGVAAAELSFDNHDFTDAELRTGDFTFLDSHATDIVLADYELPDDADVDEGPVTSAFYKLRLAYTETLLAEVLGETETRPINTESAIPFEEMNTGRRQPPVGQTARPIDDPIVVFQPSLAAEIGEWDVSGDADIVLIWPTGPDDDTAPGVNARVRVIDVKLATEEQANHQIQTVTYSIGIRQLPSVPTEQITLETGVLTQHDTYLPLIPDTVPEFDQASRETDLKQLTKAGGVLDKIFNVTDFDAVDFQLDTKCSSCQYNEVCYATAIEDAGLELLGINRGIQRTLENNGVNDLNDLAYLAEPVGADSDPVNDPKPTPTRSHRDTYETLASIAGLGEKLPELIQQTQGLLQNINENHAKVEPTHDPVTIRNTGKGNLPSDDWGEGEKWEDDFGGIPPGSMIRVYLNVQYDHVRDTIAGAGFFVTAGATTTDPISYGIMDDDMPDGFEDAHRAEARLLETFVDELFTAIERVGRGINLHNADLDNPFLHFYTYTEDEKQRLEERLAMYTTGTITKGTTSGGGETQTRDPDAQGTLEEEIRVSDDLVAFRNLLGRRSGAEQNMISPIAPELETRIAVRFPTTGIVNMYNEFYPKYSSDPVLKNKGWKYTPKDQSRAPDGKSEIDLEDVFRYRLFNRIVPYYKTKESIKLDLPGEDLSSGDGWYNSRVRTGAKIPLAYLWVASGRITDAWVEEMKNSDDSVRIDPYRYHNENADPEDAVPVTTEDVEALMERLCEALCRVEQGLSSKASNYIYVKPFQEDTEGGD
jgi:hypothetical protein